MSFGWVRERESERQEPGKKEKQSIKSIQQAQHGIFSQQIPRQNECRKINSLFWKEKHRLGMLNDSYEEKKCENLCCAIPYVCFCVGEKSLRIVFDSKNFFGQGNVKIIHQRAVCRMRRIWHFSNLHRKSDKVFFSWFLLALRHLLTELDSFI